MPATRGCNASICSWTAAIRIQRKGVKGKGSGAKSQKRLLTPLTKTKKRLLTPLTTTDPFDDDASGVQP